MNTVERHTQGWFVHNRQMRWWYAEARKARLKGDMVGARMYNRRGDEAKRLRDGRV